MEISPLFFKLTLIDIILNLEYDNNTNEKSKSLKSTFPLS